MVLLHIRLTNELKILYDFIYRERETEERLQSPKLRSSSRHPLSPSNEEPSPKIPRLSPKIKQESDDETGPSRRMTRHAYQEEVRKSREIKSPPQFVQNGARHDASPERTPTAASAASSESPRRRNRLRSSTRGSIVEIATRNGTLSDRVTPPPPLLIPNTINSNKTNSSGCSTPTYPDGGLSDKEGALNSVLAWKLVPDESYYEQSPTPASLMYGAHHLLRLFGEFNMALLRPTTALQTVGRFRRISLMRF